MPLTLLFRRFACRIAASAVWRCGCSDERGFVQKRDEAAGWLLRLLTFCRGAMAPVLPPLLPNNPVPEYKLCGAGYGSENRSFSGSAASAARRSVSARAAR